jgi:hypothetical protein
MMGIFGGSNTTGEVAESLGRHWVSCNMDVQYVAASAFRFLPKPKLGADVPDHPYHLIAEGGSVDLRNYRSDEQLMLELISK